MSNRLVRLYNTTTSSIFIRGDQIESETYYTIQESDLTIFADDSTLFNLVSNGTILVNDGGSANFTNPLEGWRWVTGNTEPPKTPEGFWSVATVAPSLVQGNDGVNWLASRYLDSQAEFSETYIIPNNRKLVITAIGCDCPNGSVFAKLEYFEELDENEFFRVNPSIDPVNIWVFNTVTSGESLTGTTDVTFNPHINAGDLPVSAIYAIAPASASQTVIGYIQVNDINTSANTISFSAFSNFDYQPNSKIALVDRALTAVGTMGDTAIINFASPIVVPGNGKNFVKLTVTNTHPTDPALMGAAVNGYLTNL